MTVYLSSSETIENNINNLINHQAFTTRKLQEVVGPADSYWPYECSDPVFILLAISSVALGILLEIDPKTIFSGKIGTVFNVKRGLLGLAIISYPLFYCVKKYRAVFAWRHEVDAAGKELAGIYSGIENYFFAELKKREKFIASCMLKQGMSQIKAEAHAQIQYEPVILQAQEINKLVKNRWAQYIPKATNQLQFVCRIYLNPSTIHSKDIDANLDNYVYQEAGEIRSFVTHEKISV